MSDFLNFILSASETIGILPTLVIAAIVALAGYMFRLNTKKEKMLQEIIKKQEDHSVMTLEAIKITVENTRMVAESSMQELIRLSSKIEGIVEIVKMVLVEKQEEHKANREYREETNQREKGGE